MKIKQLFFALGFLWVCSNAFGQQPVEKQQDFIENALNILRSSPTVVFASQQSATPNTFFALAMDSDHQLMPDIPPFRAQGTNLIEIQKHWDLWNKKYSSEDAGVLSYAFYSEDSPRDLEKLNRAYLSIKDRVERERKKDTHPEFALYEEKYAEDLDPTLRKELHAESVSIPAVFEPISPNHPFYGLVLTKPFQGHQWSSFAPISDPSFVALKKDTTNEYKVLSFQDQNERGIALALFKIARLATLSQAQPSRPPDKNWRVVFVNAYADISSPTSENMGPRHANAYYFTDEASAEKFAAQAREISRARE